MKTKTELISIIKDMVRRISRLQGKLTVFERTKHHIYRRGDYVPYYNIRGAFKGTIVNYQIREQRYIICDDKTNQNVHISLNDIGKLIKERDG